MKILQSEMIVENLVFPEGIRWHDGKIWFSDIMDFKVYTYDPRTRATSVFVELPVRPSGLGFLPNGDLLIASWDREFIRVGADGPKTLANFGNFGTMLNDMVVDASGRAYVNCYMGDPIKESIGGVRRGGLLAVETDGAVRLVDDDLVAPNGMAITPDGKTLVVNETGRIYKYRILPNGDLADRNEFAPIGGDGLCLDAEGAVWTCGAGPAGPGFIRILEGGEITHQAPVRGENVHAIAPVLGGPDRRTLYGTVHQWELPALLDAIGDTFNPQRAPNMRERIKGWLYAVEGIEVPGAGLP